MIVNSLHVKIDSNDSVVVSDGSIGDVRLLSCAIPRGLLQSSLSRDLPQVTNLIVFTDYNHIAIALHDYFL